MKSTEQNSPLVLFIMLLIIELFYYVILCCSNFEEMLNQCRRQSIFNEQY